jgi:hypothetical protein
MVAKHCLVLLAAAVPAYGHDIITTKVTFDREIVRLFNSHCNACHREGGTAFSLETWKAARPWAKAIGEEVLQRRMPPWGAVKGFGAFRNDQGLTEEQLELIVDWEEGGAPEGEPKDLPQPPKLPDPSLPESSTISPVRRTPKDILISGDTTLRKPLILAGIWPQSVEDHANFQITAELPDGSIEPLLWLHNYRNQFAHEFQLKRPLDLPAGTVVRGVPAEAKVLLRPGYSKAFTGTSKRAVFTTPLR